MPPKTYREYALDAAPPWLLEPDGAAALRALGDVRDGLVQQAKAGVKARFPRLASPDALTAIGEERGLPRSPTDTDAAYAERLVGAWEEWGWAGTPTGVLKALWHAGYTNVVLVTTRRAHTLDGAGDLVTSVLSPPRAFSPGAAFWNAFLVWFPTPFIAAWSGGVPSTSSAEADSVRRLVNRWKPAHAWPVGYVATVTGHFWGEPGLQWGDSGIDWGGTNVRWDP
jgi:hypothetical protein